MALISSMLDSAVKITPKQQLVLDYLSKTKGEYHEIKEVTQKLNLSASVLQALEKKGLIEIVEKNNLRKDHYHTSFEDRHPLTLNNEQKCHPRNPWR